jgi:hypothetical protein
MQARPFSTTLRGHGGGSEGHVRDALGRRAPGLANGGLEGCSGRLVGLLSCPSGSTDSPGPGTDRSTKAALRRIVEGQDGVRGSASSLRRATDRDCQGHTDEGPQQTPRAELPCQPGLRGHQHELPLLKLACHDLQGVIRLGQVIPSLRCSPSRTGAPSSATRRTSSRRFSPRWGGRSCASRLSAPPPRRAGV